MKVKSNKFIIDICPTLHVCSLVGLADNIGNFITIPKYFQVNNEEYILDSINDLVFKGNSHIKTVIIPDSVTQLPDRLFWECNNLSVVFIGGPVTSIPYACFAYCTNLRQIVLPSTITIIDKYAFYKCESLEKIEIPENVIRINEQAFYGCKSIRKIHFPKCTKIVEKAAFCGCSGLCECNMYNLENIGDIAFKGCTSLSTISIGNQAKILGNQVFDGCSYLKKIGLPYDLDSCGSNIFIGCNNICTAQIHDSNILNKSEEIRRLYNRFKNHIRANEIALQFKHFSLHPMPFSEAIVDVKYAKGVNYSDRYEWLSNLYLITESGYYIQCKEICRNGHWATYFNDDDNQPYDVFLDGILRTSWVYAFNNDLEDVLSFIKRTLDMGELTIYKNKNNGSYHFKFCRYGYSWI